MPHNILDAAEVQDGWTLLFDGESLKGWHAMGKPEGWAVDDQSIFCTVQKGGYLASKEQFENFVLTLEYRIAPQTNSGVFVRWSNVFDPVNTGIEIQVLDNYGASEIDKHTCGAIYDLVPPSKVACKPAGEWNQLHIECNGSIIKVVQNGLQIAEMDTARWTEPGVNPDGTPNKFTYAWASMPRRGHIGLQDHGGQVWYRNIKVKQLSS